MSSKRSSKVKERRTGLPLHALGKMLKARLSDDLRSKYAFKTARVRKGDSVRIVRGEFAGVEGKVTGVDVKGSRLTVEGVSRERVKGEQTPVKIHVSKVVVTSLNLDDKYRKVFFETHVSGAGGGG
ncbi:MAG: 50S ribosomal protein L24 [Nitrososphaeria archaeon]